MTFNSRKKKTPAIGIDFGRHRVKVAGPDSSNLKRWNGFSEVPLMISGPADTLAFGWEAHARIREQRTKQYVLNFAEIVEMDRQNDQLVGSDPLYAFVSNVLGSQLNMVSANASLVVALPELWRHSASLYPGRIRSVFSRIQGPSPKFVSSAEASCLYLLGRGDGGVMQVSDELLMIIDVSNASVDVSVFELNEHKLRLVSFETSAFSATDLNDTSFDLAVGRNLVEAATVEIGNHLDATAEGLRFELVRRADPGFLPRWLPVVAGEEIWQAKAFGDVEGGPSPSLSQILQALQPIDLGVDEAVKRQAERHRNSRLKVALVGGLGWLPLLRGRVQELLEASGIGATWIDTDLSTDERSGAGALGARMLADESSDYSLCRAPEVTMAVHSVKAGVIQQVDFSFGSDVDGYGDAFLQESEDIPQSHVDVQDGRPIVVRTGASEIVISGDRMPPKGTYRVEMLLHPLGGATFAFRDVGGGSDVVVSVPNFPNLEIANGQ